jgi:hypothetical protein
VIREVSVEVENTQRWNGFVHEAALGTDGVHQTLRRERRR